MYINANNNTLELYVYIRKQGIHPNSSAFHFASIVISIIKYSNKILPSVVELEGQKEVVAHFD